MKLNHLKMLLALSFVLQSCGGGEATSEPGRSITGRLYSTSVSVYNQFPARNATEVPPDSLIQLEFTGGSLSSDLENLELYKFYAVNAETGDVVPATLELNEDRTILTMIPEQGLETGTTYDVHSLGLTDEEGAYIAQFHSRFITQQFGKGRGDFEVIDIKPSGALAPNQPFHVTFSRPISTTGNLQDLVAAWTDRIQVSSGLLIDVRGRTGLQPIEVKVKLRCDDTSGCATLEVSPKRGTWIPGNGFGLGGILIDVKASDGTSIGIQAADNREGNKAEQTSRTILPWGD